ncbi:hypothetical protein MJO28_009413 [Puccinia striiformis f. sp. tritici]|uniref:Uncharacterized protein n=1 Tax=Puccinia striiformis f. sp. tritici TaxID=168172 RepID=A0ACC0E705_9BASI|nr:hypothetical protein MJO28_017835 [Puccinia striiformis f. sp. tritici]KAI7947505.1 hypothetical protein MJO28_009413 [Puccinia striiformis f. sp. tritici]KAI9628046.1 hypothetical protein H4Q26_018231 [Puccinia striiformis f. sp. tritici PST-130]KAI9629002.1 hypothetical protein H4Q26_018373 [Puccinia striiformis f. sp. tritici PST-130]
MTSEGSRGASGCQIFMKGQYLFWDVEIVDEEGALQVESLLRAQADLTGEVLDKTKTYQELSFRNNGPSLTKIWSISEKGNGDHILKR